MTERQEESEQEKDNEQPQQSDQEMKDTLDPGFYEFTEVTPREGVIELSATSESHPSSDNNGGDDDNGGGDTSDDSLEPEYIERGNDEAESSERR